jgi:hypothetical protein
MFLQGFFRATGSSGEVKKKQAAALGSRRPSGRTGAVMQQRQQWRVAAWQQSAKAAASGVMAVKEKG